MSRSRLGAFTLVLVSMAAHARAEAILIDLSAPTIMPSDVTLIGTTNVNRNLSTGAMEDLWDVEIGELLYKDNVGGDESGAAASYYTTTYSNSANDPSEALITWDGPAIISCPACYLLVKGGATTPAQYLFNLGSWDGEDSITLKGFWPRQGAISHVTLFGAGTTVVPEPASLTLLLLGIGSMSAARYRARRRT
jgi:hypothetical protein